MKIDPIKCMNVIKDKQRPTIKDYLPLIFDEYIELHGDRYFGDDHAVFGGIATFKGRTVTVIATVKGKNTSENIDCNFAMAHPDGYRKALRLMKQAEKFHRPVICFVDTAGAHCGVSAEERGQGEAIARNLYEMSILKTPIISIITGEGGSGGALALAVADEVDMLTNAIYSVISPQGFASILWKDSSKVNDAAKVLKLTSADLKGFGIIDNVIPEPMGNAATSHKKMAENISTQISAFLKAVDDTDVQSLLDKRYEKFRKIGVFTEN